MFRGLLAGVVWGGLASALMLAIVSFLAPPVEGPQVDSPAQQAAPEAQEPEAQAPGERREDAPDAGVPNEEEGRAPEATETEAQQPSAPDTAPAPNGIAAPDARDGDDSPAIVARPDAPADAETGMDGLSALVPDGMPAPGEGVTPRPQLLDGEPRLDSAPDAASRDALVEAPGLDDGVAAVTPDAGQPSAPDAAPGAGLRDGAPAPAPQLDQPRDPELPAEADGAAELPAQAGDDSVRAEGPPPGVRQAETDAPPPVFPQIAPEAPAEMPPAMQEPDGEDSPAEPAAPDPRVGLTPAPGVETLRLPRIGDDAPDAQPAELPGDVQTGEDAQPDEPLPALRRNAADFDNPEDRPLFAIIMMDDGIAPDDQDRLARLPFPVTIAVDPTLPDAAERSALYRREGKEVLMLASAIPQGASASDLEVTFQGHFGALPDAVGVLDLPEGGFQNDRQLAEQVITVIAEDGYGLVTFDRGMNAAEQVARSAGLGTERVFRILDAEGERAEVIRRYLDRAVFRAAQRGSVIVLGGSREETLAGILEWRMEGRADAVELAPVSAVLAAAQ